MHTVCAADKQGTKKEAAAAAASIHECMTKFWNPIINFIRYGNECRFRFFTKIEQKPAKDYEAMCALRLFSFLLMVHSMHCCDVCPNEWHHAGWNVFFSSQTRLTKFESQSCLHSFLTLLNAEHSWLLPMFAFDFLLLPLSLKLFNVHTFDRTPIVFFKLEINELMYFNFDSIAFFFRCD